MIVKRKKLLAPSRVQIFIFLCRKRHQNKTMGIFDRLFINSTIDNCSKTTGLEIVSTCEATVSDLMDAAMRQILARFPPSSVNMKKLDDAIRRVLVVGRMTIDQCLRELICMEKRFNCEWSSASKVQKYRALAKDEEFKTKLLDNPNFGCEEFYEPPATMLPAYAMTVGFAALPLSHELRQMEKDYRDLCILEVTNSSDAAAKLAVAQTTYDKIVEKQKEVREQIKTIEKTIKELVEDRTSVLYVEGVTQNLDDLFILMVSSRSWNNVQRSMALRLRTLRGDIRGGITKERREASVRGKTVGQTGWTEDELQKFKTALAKHVSLIVASNKRRKDRYVELQDNMRKTILKVNTVLQQYIDREHTGRASRMAAVSRARGIYFKTLNLTYEYEVLTAMVKQIDGLDEDGIVDRIINTMKHVDAKISFADGGLTLTKVINNWVDGMHVTDNTMVAVESYTTQLQQLPETIETIVGAA